MTGPELLSAAAPFLSLLWAGAVYTGAGSSVPFIYTEAARFDPIGRFPAGAVLHLVSNGRDTVLFPGFTASADAAVSFDGHRVLFSGKQRPGDKWQIWEAPIAGGGPPRRMVTTPEDCITPFYLPADRIVFARRMPQGFQLHIAALAGRNASPVTFGPGNQIVADVLRDGRVLFESDHAAGIRDLYTVYTDGSGVETHRCDHRHNRHSGRGLSNGDIVFEAGGKLAKFTSTRAGEIPMVVPGGEFTGPVAEVNPAEWLVSIGRSLYRWAPGESNPGSALAANAVQPVVVRARTRPNIHPSSLGNREGANTLCLSVYTSKLRIQPESVATVRLWTRDDRGLPLALGTAPVERDGSFFVTAPADRPVRFELLDTAGKTVAAENGWFWYRRGEQRICVGCHAGPERAADNVQPQVLLRSTEPVKLMGLK